MMLKLHWINHWTIMHIVHMETLTYFTDPIIPNSKVNISKVLTQFQDSTVPREQRNIDTLLEKCPWVPVESALWYQFLEPVPKSGTKGSSLWYRVKQPVPMAKIFTQNILWLGFEPATSSLVRCYFTISPTQQFWLRRRYFPFEVTHGEP